MRMVNRLILTYDKESFSKALADSYREKICNVGLAFEKYVNIWIPVKTSGIKLTDDKSEFFNEICEVMRENRVIQKSLSETHSRLNSLVEVKHGTSISLEVEWRLVIGLGGTHPLETGFIWDRNLGVPMIPASSIKGALRAWFTTYRNPPMNEDEIDRLLGKNGAGQITIFDALPSDRPNLEVDIINVHFADYYNDPMHKDPAEYTDPNPIHFLTVGKNTKFIFRFLSRNQNQNDLEIITKELKQMVSKVGIGAKVSVGYGRLH